MKRNTHFKNFIKKYWRKIADAVSIVFILAFVAVIVVSYFSYDKAMEANNKYNTVNNPEAEETLAPAPTPTPPPPPEGDDIVYRTKSGEKYHIVNDCGGMNPDNAFEVTVNEAVEDGLTACSRCIK